MGNQPVFFLVCLFEKGPLLTASQESGLWIWYKRQAGADFCKRKFLATKFPILKASPAPSPFFFGRKFKGMYEQLLEDLAGKMNMKLFQHSICAQGDVEI